MQIIVDGKSGFELESGVDSIAGALELLVEHLDVQGRGLLALSIDGDPVLPDDLSATVGERGIDEIEVLEVQSASYRELIEESIREAMDVVPELHVACLTLAEIVAGDSPQDGFAQFNDLKEIWEAVKERQQQIAEVLNVSPDTVTVEKDSIATLHTNLTECLDKASKALESGDFAALSDILSYDLAALAELERAIFDALRAHLPPGPEQTP